MSSSTGRSVLRRLEISHASRRAVAREAYEAYDFGVRIESGETEGFFFATHRGEAVMARKIIVFPNADAPAKVGWFCVAFEQGTTIVKEAFAYTDKDNYYGRLPEDFAPGGGDVDDDTPPFQIM